MAEASGPRSGATPPTPAERLSLYVAALRRHLALAVAIVLAAILAGTVVAALSPRSYEATAKVLIGQRAQVDALLGATDYTPDPERDVNTNVQLITLEPVAESVSRELGLDVPAGELTSKVKTEIDGNSNLVSITARDSTAEGAAAIANAFARAYRDFRQRAARASIDDAVASAESRAAELPPGAERDALTEELRRLQAAAAFQTGGVQIVRRADAASAVASGGVRSSAILAGFLGVVLAAVAVVLLARTDKRLRSTAELGTAAGCPVLATVRYSRGPEGPARARDSFATLALSLVLRRARMPNGTAKRQNGRSARVLLLTSPGPDEGTTEAALGLALALGEMGQPAIVVEADLRAPAMAELLGLKAKDGLVSVLAGTRTLDDELVEIVSPHRRARSWVLPVGPARDVPQPLLAGARMRSVVADARAKAPIVILVGAPAARFGDSLALTTLADAVVLVARIDVTRREELVRVAGQLKELNSPPLGAVAIVGAAPRMAGVAHPAQPNGNGSLGNSPIALEVASR